MMTPQQVIADFIRTWEGGLSLHKADTGNWVGNVLVGSKYGVTAAALANHRRVSVSSITPQIMRDLAIEEAAEIGYKNYYDKPQLDLLPWNRVTASLLDAGWGMGPPQAIKLMQRIVEAADDGKIGPQTAGLYSRYLEAHGEVALACEFAFARINFYIDITEKRPSNLQFLNGWTARTAYFTPSSAERNKGWWKRFVAEVEVS